MNYLDQNQLQEYFDNCKVEELKTLSRAHILTVLGERLNCQLGLISKSKQDIYLESKNEILGKIGVCVKAKSITKIELSTPENKPRLISLNVGSFGINCLNNGTKTEYEDSKLAFLEFLQTQVNKVLILNLQDFPSESTLFEQISEYGFDVYFIPNQFSSLGKFSDRSDCGQAILINKNIKGYNLDFLNLSISFHHGGFFNHSKSFRKYSSKDLLQKPMTLFITLFNQELDQTYLISNVYISAFNTKANRFKSLKDSINVLSSMQGLLSKRSTTSEFIVRMTGDFNLYGYNTQNGLLGFDAEPYSHLPAAFWAVLTGFRPHRFFSHGKIFKHGINLPNLKEVEKVKDWLLENHFGVSLDVYNKLNLSKTLYLTEFTPWALKRFFRGAAVSWVLDMCIYPLWSRKFRVWYELEPYGKTDHKTMFVQL